MHHIPYDIDVPEETRLEPTRRRRLRGAALMTTGLFAVAVTVAACGGPSTPGVATGSTTTTTTTATTTSSGDGGTQGSGPLAYTSCMRSHGVPNFPDPGDKGGFPKPAVVSALQQVSSSRGQAASSTCEHLLPAGGSLSGKASEPVTTPQQQQDYLKAVACLRSQGFPNFPDPVFSGGSVHFTVPSSLNTNSTQFAHARLVCQKLIPAGLPYSGGS
jgi:hypothetical protein